MTETDSMMVVLSTGKHDRGARATLAFSWACTGLAMGKKVTIFLTMEGTIWGLKGAAETVKVEGFDPLHEYLEQFIALGGEILICAPCSEYYCSIPKLKKGEELIPEAQLSGLSTIVSMINPTTSVVSF